MPNPTFFSHIDNPAKTLAITIQKVSGSLDQYFDPLDRTFKTGLTYSQKKIALVEGTSENVGTYETSIVGLSGTDGLTNPGLVRIRVHDESLSNRTIRAAETFVVNGEITRMDVFPGTLATSAQVLTQLQNFVNNTFQIPELAVLPGRTPTIAQFLALAFMHFRWKTFSDDKVFRLMNADGETMFEANLTKDENGFTRGELQNVA